MLMKNRHSEDFNYPTACINPLVPKELWKYETWYLPCWKTECKLLYSGTDTVDVFTCKDYYILIPEL